MGKIVVKIIRTPVRGGTHGQMKAREALRQQANTWIADNKQYAAGILTAGVIQREKYAPSYLSEEKDYFVIRIYEETKN